MKKILLSLTLMLLPLFAYAQSTQKIAVVDTQEILMAMPETKSMQTELDALMKKFEDTIVVMQEEFQTKYKAYVAEQEGMVESIKLRKEQELQDMAQRLDDLGKTAQEEVQKKRMELFEPIQKKVMTAIQTVGADNGYAYVLDKSAMVYVGTTGIDATAQVKAKLGL